MSFFKKNTTTSFGFCHFTRFSYSILVPKIPKTRNESFLSCFSDTANWQRANMWSLLQDNEYVLSKLYASVDIFPTLLGTCGGLYVVEALEPLAFPPRYFAKLSFNQWAQRVSVTLAILDLLDELENVFEDPVHLCDVKPEHFGISDFGKVKVLDLDSVFLKSHLGNLKKNVKWKR